MNYMNTEMSLVKEASELMMEELDPTTYDGEHAINYFIAEIHLNNYLDNIMESAELEYILKYLSKLPVKPIKIDVYDVGYIEIYWKSNGYQVISSKADYIQLIMEFKLFLRKFKSPFFNIQLHYYFFHGSETSSIEGIAEEVINFSPKFNQACFGSDKEIEVTECKIF